MEKIYHVSLQNTGIDVTFPIIRMFFGFWHRFWKKFFQSTSADEFLICSSKITWDLWPEKKCSSLEKVYKNDSNLPLNFKNSTGKISTVLIFILSNSLNFAILSYSIKSHYIVVTDLFSLNVYPAETSKSPISNITQIDLVMYYYTVTCRSEK